MINNLEQIIDEYGLWCEHYGRHKSDIMRSKLLNYIEKLIRMERNDCIAEVETGIWFDLSTEEILESITKAMKERA
jgi:hypothetical protein